MKWQPIESIPTNILCDVWAKTWDYKSDAFEYRRFADVKLIPPHEGRENGEWVGLGLAVGWKITHWRLLPEPPTED